MPRAPRTTDGNWNQRGMKTLARGPPNLHRKRSGWGVGCAAPANPHVRRAKGAVGIALSAAMAVVDAEKGAMAPIRRRQVLSAGAPRAGTTDARCSNEECVRSVTPQRVRRPCLQQSRRPAFQCLSNRHGVCRGGSCPGRAAPRTSGPGAPGACGPRRAPTPGPLGGAIAAPGGRARGASSLHNTSRAAADNTPLPSVCIRTTLPPLPTK